MIHLCPTTLDQLDLLWLTRGEGIDVDQVVADIIDDAEWVDPVPAVRGSRGAVADVSELWVPRSPCRSAPVAGAPAQPRSSGKLWPRPSGNDKR